MDAFSTSSLHRFETELTAHFRDHLPVHYHALGEEGTRQAIRYGIERARSYAIQTEPGIATYIRHMFLFGRDFDRDPQLSWAGRVLLDMSILNERQRIERLSESSLEHLRALDAGQTG